MSRRKKHSCPGLLSISFPSGPQAMVEEKRSHHGPPDSLYSAMKRTSFKRTSSSYSGVKEQRLPPSTLSFLSFRKEKQIKTEREKRPCITQKSISFACSRPFTLFQRFQLEKCTGRKRIHWNGCKYTESTFEFSKRVGGDRNKEPVISPQK